jgi:serine protease
VAILAPVGAKRVALDHYREEIMHWLRIGVIGFIGIWLLQALADRADAQGSPPQQFVPGELIVGYKTPQDREDAIRDMRDKKEKMRVRGEIPSDVQVRKVGESSLAVHIDYPTINRNTRDNPASEYTLLEEVAKQLKDNDSRVKYAHPNWIMRIDPPGAPDDAKIQPQKLNGIEGDKTRSATGPNDPLYALQWDLHPLPEGMNAVGAWNISKGSTDIVVAVLDTGILYNQEDINGSGNVLPGYNFISKNLCTNEKVSRSSDATDLGDSCKGGRDTWHGTHVAGTVGAVGSNNGKGVVGVAWNVSVLPVRVLGPNGGSTSDIVDAMRWAAGLPVAGVPINKHPADIINMSLGSPIRGGTKMFECTEQYFGEYIDAIREVRQAGVIVVASAGNGEYIDGDNHSCTPDAKNPQCKHVQDDVKNAAPGGCPGVISVAASDPEGHLAYYSNYGAVTIMAPGGDVTQSRDYIVGGQRKQMALGVWSSYNGAYYMPYQGTSQAAPHVAGAIALALAAHPEWRHKPDLVEKALRTSAVTPVEGACPQRMPCGPGQLDAVKFLEAKPR